MAVTAYMLGKCAHVLFSSIAVGGIAAWACCPNNRRICILVGSCLLAAVALGAMLTPFHPAGIALLKCGWMHLKWTGTAVLLGTVAVAFYKNMQGKPIGALLLAIAAASILTIYGSIYLWKPLAPPVCATK